MFRSQCSLRCVVNMLDCHGYNRTMKYTVEAVREGKSLVPQVACASQTPTHRKLILAPDQLIRNMLCWFYHLIYRGA